LANLLRSDNGALKRDRELAERLAAKLDQELAAGGTGEDDTLLRVYLATALGEFYVDAGLPVLVKAIVRDEQTDVKPSLRVAATRAVAVLSNNLQREMGQPISDPEAIAAVIQASREEDSMLRTTAALNRRWSILSSSCWPQRSPRRLPSGNPQPSVNHSGTNW
jgi:hypothetical protein